MPFCSPTNSLKSTHSLVLFTIVKFVGLCVKLNGTEEKSFCLYDNFAPFWPAVPRFKPVCKNYLGFDGSQFETRPFHVSVIVFVFSQT